MKKLVTWAVVVALAVAGVGGLFKQSSIFRNFVGQYLPGTAKTDESVPRRVQGFAEQLESNLQSFGQMREKVQTQLIEQTKIHRERDHELLGVQALLARFKDEYAVGIGPGGFPRQILGRSYSKETIENQVELLLKRRTELEQKASHNTAVTEKLQKSLSELDQRIGTTKTHLESMPTYLTLVETHALTGQSDQAVAGLESCLASNEALLDATVRNSTELLKALQDERQASAQKTSVRDFLTSGPAKETVPQPIAKPEGFATPAAAQATSGDKVNCPTTSPQELPSSIKALLGSQSATVAN